MNGAARGVPTAQAWRALSGCVLAATLLSSCSRGAAEAARADPHSATAPLASDDDTSSLLGRAPSEWQASHWLNSAPLSLSDLRGRVVFVRWFMSPDCPFCSGTAPGLRELHQRYAAAGLVVVGMYHHKDAARLDPANVQAWAKHYGYEFPVAIDDEWRTLNRWWLNGHPNRRYTSVSFIIDREGLLQRVHLGGLIDSKSEEFRSISADIERLLARKSPSGSAEPAAL